MLFSGLAKIKKALRQNPQSLDFIELMAERVGFEPTVPVKGHLISSQAPSTTRTPLHYKLFTCSLFTALPEKGFHYISTLFFHHARSYLQTMVERLVANNVKQ